MIGASDYFHHGLMAELNDLQNAEDAPEVDWFERFLRTHAGPALDAGCGPGRLLRRCLRAGLDVEGSDISAEMLAICRRRAAADGLSPTLHHQSTARLDLPRRYRAIVLSGSFAINGTRDDDQEALRRVRRHLEPGGALALDVEAGWSLTRVWRRCSSPSRGRPTRWRSGAVNPTPDGAVIRGSTRIRRADPLHQEAVVDVRLERLSDGRVVAREHDLLVERWYTQRDLVAMLDDAGFGDVEATGDYTDAPLAAEHRMQVYTARAV